MKVIKSNKEYEGRCFINPAIFAKVQLENARKVFLEKIDKAFKNLECGNIEGFDDSVSLEIPLVVIEDIMSKSEDELEIYIKYYYNFKTFIQTFYKPSEGEHWIDLQNGDCLLNIEFSFDDVLTDLEDSLRPKNVNFRNFTFDMKFSKSYLSYAFRFPFYTEIRNEALIITFTLKDYVKRFHNKKLYSTIFNKNTIHWSKANVEELYGEDCIVDGGEDDLEYISEHQLSLNSEEPYSIIKHLNEVFRKRKLSGIEGYKNMMLKILSF